MRDTTPWQMVAKDQAHDPIYGPWETKAEAERRARDAVDGHFIVSAEVVPLK